jgi:hypothetical protein
MQSAAGTLPAGRVSYVSPVSSCVTAYLEAGIMAGHPGQCFLKQQQQQQQQQEPCLQCYGP